MKEQTEYLLCLKPFNCSHHMHSWSFSVNSKCLTQSLHILRTLPALLTLPTTTCIKLLCISNIRQAVLFFPALFFLSRLSFLSVLSILLLASFSASLKTHLEPFPLGILALKFFPLDDNIISCFSLVLKVKSPQLPAAALLRNLLEMQF